MKKGITLILLQLTLGLLCLVQAQAGVGVSPPRVELEGNALAQLSQEIVIDNPSEISTLDIKVTLSDALIQPNGDVLFVDPGSHPNSLTSWLSLSSLGFTLEPKASEAITYTAQVPEGTPNGTYWGILFFEAQPADASEQETDGIGVRNRVRVGHIVYVHVGQTTRVGQIEGIRYATEREPELRVMFRNSGNGLVRAQGQIEVRSEEGELLRTLAVPESAALPGYAREISAALETPLDPGSYVVLAVLDYGEATVTAGEGRIEVP